MQPRIHTARSTFVPACVLATALAACGGAVTSSTDNQLPRIGMAGALASANFATNPATGRPFVVEPNSGGNATSLKVLQVVSGRLADVYDRDPASGARTLRFVDLLIGADIDSNGVDFLLEQKPLTQKAELTVLHAFGTPSFATAFDALEAGLQTFALKSFDPGELPPFTAMPRNAALAIRFDDLLRDGGNPGDPNYPATISASNVQLFVGSPPASPFEARVLPDPNHGDLENGKFHSTRVIVDVSISALEALATGLPVNPIGLPGATTTAVASAGLRLPTAVNTSVGQFQVVTNLNGAHIAFTGNGPTDPASPTLDVVRAFRSGGKTALTGDPYDGFLPDNVRPNLLVELPSFLSSVHPTAVATDFRVTVRFPDPDCVPRVRVGDLVLTPTNTAELVQVTSTGALARVIAGSPANFAVGSALFKTTWSPTIHLRPECVTRFSPTPGDPPVKQVSTNASVLLSFSEPIAPESVRAFDTFRVQYAQSPNPLQAYVVGSIAPSVGLDRFNFVPALPLRHMTGQTERYSVDVDGSATGITDLAGNPLEFDLPPADFFLDAANATVHSGGIALRFASTDEDGDGKPELRGQFLYDLNAGEIHPRPVQRFSGIADPSAPVVGAMIPLPSTKVQVPLSNYGAKLMNVWRYHDLNLAMLDEQTHNLDVEGLNWAPFANQVVADDFQRFQMSFAHSKFLPDEELSTSLLPNWPGSGLVNKYDDNLLDPNTDPLSVVHPAANGYTINPADAFTAASTSGFTMMPWPLNQGVPLANYNYWTWRDTAKIAVGGPNGNGADTQRLFQVTKTGNPSFYSVNKVPTIALPLLTEFRTYPDANANAQNGFRIAIALNSSANPYFRAFSAGYVSCFGATVNLDPDTNTTAVGGYDLIHCTVAGPRDNVFYYGQADFVVRVSRLHTVWFDTQDPNDFAPPVLELGASAQPAGTQVQVAFRGATAITTTMPTSWRDAGNYDAYGDGFNAFQLIQLGKPTNLAFTPSFLGNPTDKTWKNSASTLNGARFVQARVSFVSNAETNATASLSSLGIAFQH